MADKAISDLAEALQIFSGDWFVLQQGSEAKKLNGNTLKQYLAQIEVNSIESVTFDIQGRCHIVLTDGTEIISQPLKGANGVDGTDGEDGADAPTITNIAIDANYHLIVTLSDGTSYDAGYCRGASGAGTGDMLAEDYDPNDAVAMAGGIQEYITERYNPSAKTAEMTQEVGKDSNGKLWTNPAPQGNFLPLTGGTMTGAIAMGGNGITGLSAPTNNADAATKYYVDTHSGGGGLPRKCELIGSKSFRNLSTQTGTITLNKNINDYDFVRFRFVSSTKSTEEYSSVILQLKHPSTADYDNTMIIYSEPDHDVALIRDYIKTNDGVFTGFSEINFDVEGSDTGGTVHSYSNESVGGSSFVWENGSTMSFSLRGHVGDHNSSTLTIYGYNF